ncbi:MAG: SusC/RagA family TonB-linked outer membrane protein [Mucilaginibacter polytrichastri]|nr:SusC/RagA family TonB-linked outer membrane protein [Mucilaginibacter polytrichastri]
MKKIYFLLVLSILSTSVFAQNRTLRGTVKDSKTGTPLIGATLGITGSAVKVATDENGAFSLPVPEKAVSITVTYIGYTTKAVSVPAGQTSVNVSLDEGSNEMSEVVVTALGITKESRKVGYAVTAVSGEQMNKARESNVALSLGGRIAGVSVTGSSGGPGSSAKILLRGVTSMTQAGSPLFVINGVPMDNTQRGSAGEWGGADQGDGISNLNPDDIESMTVLKGASASALYGNRAANGVILVTTKSGKAGTFAVEYNSNIQIDRAIDFTDFQKVYGQGLDGARPTTVAEALSSGRQGWGERLDGAPTIQWDGNTYPYSAVNGNINNFYRDAPAFTNTLSVGSGTDKGNFRLSASDLRQQSVLRNSNLKRNTINLNINQTIWDKLQVSAMVNYVDERSKLRPNLSDGPLNPNNIFFLAPNIDQSILAPGYSLTSTKGDETQWNDNIYETNPYFVVNRMINDVSRRRLIASLSAKYNFTDWMSLQARLGYDFLSDRYFKVNPTGLAYSQDLLGSLDNLTTGTTLELNPDVLLSINRDIVKDLNFNFAGGAAFRRNRSESIGISGGPFVIPFFYSPFNVTNFGRSYGIGVRETQSAYYSADFTYKNFLTLSTTGRYDVYSPLPASDRAVFTPSVSGSFIFSDLIKVPAINYGKLRASYSQTSGDVRQDQLYASTFYYNVGNAIGGVSTGNFANSLPNLFLKPFTLSEIEVGTEMKFLNNRLGLDVAYFHRKSKNEIFNGGLSASTGYTEQVIPTGSIENKGLEMLITGSPIKTDNFSWNVSLNSTYVTNKVLDINGPESTNFRSTLGTYRPFNANLAYVKGMAGPQIMAYDWMYDANGNQVVDAAGVPQRAALLQPMGSVTPKWFGGINNEFNLKGVSLSFLVDYKAGFNMLSATKYYALSRGLDMATLPYRETGIVVPGVLADGSPNTTNISAQQYYRQMANVSKYEIMNASFIKLRQVTLGYTFSGKMLGQMPFEGITVSLVGRNLLTLLKYTDNVDPESAFSTQVGYTGIEGGGLPTTRTYGVNVNFKFKK